jgi:hypothetical protein
MSAGAQKFSAPKAGIDCVDFLIGRYLCWLRFYLPYQEIPARHRRPIRSWVKKIGRHIANPSMGKVGQSPNCHNL